MRVVIRGHHLPGRRFVSDGRPLANVHVALQVGRDPVGLVRGDADGAQWEADVRVLTDADGRLDFRGPVVQGKRGDRFLYLTWGDVDEAGTFSMFRRAKLMLHRIDVTLVEEAEARRAALVAHVELTDDHGCPRCARVDPPAITWSVGDA